MLDCFKKEFGCGNNSSHSIVYLSYNECLIFTILSDYLLVFGFLGFIAQAYVVFCYGYRRNEEFIPIQVLILGTSVFDMLCCFGLVFNFSLIRYPTFYEIRLRETESGLKIMKIATCYFEMGKNDFFHLKI